MVIFSAILGLFGSLLPEILKLFNNYQEHKQQLELARLGHLQEMEKINTQADIAEQAAAYGYAKPSEVGILGMIATFVASMVRPVITYSFFGLYAMMKYALYIKAIAIGTAWTEAVQLVWTSDDMSIFAAILGFWFGQRGVKWAFSRFSPPTKLTLNGNGNGKPPVTPPVDDGFHHDVPPSV